MEYLLLIGKDIDSPEVQQYLDKFPYEPERVSFRDCFYLNLRKDGVSICFDQPSTEVKSPSNAEVGAFHFYNQGVDDYLGFCGTLPEELSMNMKAWEIVEKLGEPSKKGGGIKGVPVWILYEPKGLQINFVGTSWDDKDNAIAFVTLYKA
ncbi:hypothetical protein K493DRAFT_298409 [Basidiobolus meristosporus CBS 931.73]|uniref:Uncharacterized protein n=1 Tax=Basidiobolus meristosporus CBS 931.73 TaxID=1314790 RepID=A0A1Y1YU96_9FUNG|nr:hypothetical protein K493DRAFT_298409 [Basidiobolus meristosporus CBS 931.73]|eukprot:ORY01404.1 hypothetical protein K493DRAFT_298409 [Basidiobolus meristosporus CBS 931.73]